MSIDGKSLGIEGERRSAGRRYHQALLQLGEACDRTPAFWSPKLDEYLEYVFNASDLAMFVHGKAVNKASSRNITAVSDPEVYSEEDTVELMELIKEVSQNGQGIESALRLFWGDVFLNCRGGYLYIMGSSEMVEPPNNMLYGGVAPELVQGPLKALEDENGDLVTLSSGLPIYGVGVVHLDARRVQRTSDPQWPVVYRNSEGKNIPVHESRLISFTDNPSTNLDLNGVGRCSALRSIRTATIAQWHFRMVSEEVGDAPSRRILYPRSGMSFDQFEEALNDGIQSVVNGEGSIILMGPEEESETDLVLEELHLKQFPSDYDPEVSFTLQAIQLGQAHYLTPADLGITSILRASSRANAEIEAENQKQTGIPEMQASVYSQLSRKLMPTGVTIEGEQLSQPSVEEEIARSEELRENVTSFYDRQIIGRETSLDLLFEGGIISLEQYEREKAETPTAVSVVPQFKKKIVRFDEHEEAEEDLIEAFVAILLAQYLGVNVQAIYDYIEANDLDPNSETFLADIEGVVAENTPELADFDGVSDLLIASGMLGVATGLEAGNREATEGEIADIEETVAITSSLRSDALFCQGEGNDIPVAGDIREPRLPQCLNAFSLVAIGHIVRSALRSFIDPVEDYRAKAIDSATARGQRVGIYEQIRSNANGYYTAVNVFNPLTKQWTQTISKDPREEHLATVGEVVPFDGIFSNGLFWAGEVPNCKCGIKVGY